jgi:hypothetical protein
MEQFKSIRGKHGLSSHYYEVAGKIWQDVITTFPRTFQSLKPCFDYLDAGDIKACYDLIYGKVQSGKSRAMMMLIWYASFIKVDIVPVILTINLGSVRSDFMGKASAQGEINRCVSDSVNRHFPSHPEWSDLFQLKAVDFKDFRRDSRFQIGKVLVLLQNSANLRELIKFYHQNCRDPLRSVMVLIDEVQKMYTVPMEKRLDGLTGEDARDLKNQKMMYWLHEKAKTEKIYLLGVTATPGRSIADVHLYPRQAVQLDSDPVKDRIYYGKLYGGTGKDFAANQAPLSKEGFIQCRPSKDELETIKKIAAAPNQVIGGVRAIKSVLVTVERTKKEHQALQTEIESDLVIGQKAVVWIVNSDTDEVSEQFKELEKKLQTDGDLRRRLATGVLVIIGKGCFSAGVSVRPGPNVNIAFNYNGSRYQLFGLTDQIYHSLQKDGNGCHLEKNIQAMRLFGYYPEGYCPTLWLRADGEKPVKEQKKSRSMLIDQLQTNQDLVDRYQRDPRSISSFITRLRFDLYDGSPYKRNLQRNFKIQKVRTRPLDVDHEMETEVLPIGQWLKEAGELDQWEEREPKPWTQIQDFHTRRGDNSRKGDARKSDVECFRKVIMNTVKSMGKTIPGNRFLIPYNQQRYHELLRAVVHPQAKQINSLLTGPLGPATSLEETQLIIFKEPMKKGDPRNSDQYKYCYRDGPDSWVVIHPSNAEIELYHHKYLDEIDGDLCEEHHESIARLDQMITESVKSGKAPRNGWIMFLYWYRSIYGKQSIKQYSTVWKGYSDAERKTFTNAVKDGMTLDQLSKRLAMDRNEEITE